MRRLNRIGVILSSTTVIIVGLTTLIGLLLGDFVGSWLWLKNIPVAGDFLGFLPDNFMLPTAGIATVFIQIAVLTIAMSIIVGIFNLLGVNTVRMFRTIREYPNSRVMAAINSAIIIVTFIATLILYIIDQNGDSRRSMILLEDVQVPIEAALSGLLFFALVYGAFRMLRDRTSYSRILFIVTVLVVLLGALPFTTMERLTMFTDWILLVPVQAGASGILLGIALATVVTGLRILIGQDRTYGE